MHRTCKEHKVVPTHSMKTCRGNGCETPLIKFNTTCGWVVSLMPWPLPLGNYPLYPLNRRLGGPWSQSRSFQRVIPLSMLGFELLITERVGEIKKYTEIWLGDLNLQNLCVDWAIILKCLREIWYEGLAWESEHQTLFMNCKRLHKLNPSVQTSRLLARDVSYALSH